MVFRYASYNERDKYTSATYEVLRNAWVANAEHLPKYNARNDWLMMKAVNQSLGDKVPRPLPLSTV